MLSPQLPHVTSNRPSRTDHLPIVTTLDFTYTPTARPERFNYRAIDWEEYNKKLKLNLVQINTLLAKPIDTSRALEHITDSIFEAINRAT